MLNRFCDHIHGLCTCLGLLVPTLKFHCSNHYTIVSFSCLIHVASNCRQPYTKTMYPVLPTPRSKRQVITRTTTPQCLGEGLFSCLIHGDENCKRHGFGSPIPNPKLHCSKRCTTLSFFLFNSWRLYIHFVEDHSYIFILKHLVWESRHPD